MQNIEEVYKKYSNAVYKYLFCLTQDELLSEDLTQETFAIAVKEIKKFKGNCKISVWLCQIAKHLWYKKLKKDKHITFEELTEDIKEPELIEETILKNESRINFFKSMQKLDYISREVVYLRVIGELNFIEIAEILGKTPNWARVTFYRAKQKIREVNRNGKEN